MVWSDLGFDIDGKDWHYRTFCIDVDITRFTDDFKVRFGFESKGEFPVLNDGWWFNTADVSFTAIK
ncbi:MAG: hypothetical protein LBQ27_06430 [Clostridiales bacterium]|jgi:hypothetical protein|nr:hypothetical protein [Clostridiales bacterium]